MPTYSELRIRFEPAANGGGYMLYASGPAGETRAHFQLPGSKLELENLALRLSRGRTLVRRVDSPELALVRRFGTDLFDAVFSGDVRDLYRDSVTVARGEGKGLRLTLALTRAPELLNVPWEYLYDDPSFLSISTWTPVVRYLDLPRSRPPLAVTQPLRILAMVSSPSDVVSLDVGQERANLEQALADVTARGAVSIRWLEQATLRELQRELRRVDYHVFHYIGHGGYDTALDDGILLLEDDQGKSRRVGGAQLGAMLADETTLRLAVLNSCEGARTSSDDPYAGVATSLIQREVPAVVAMQFEITDRAAIVFAGEFYAAVADGYPVDSALAEARKAIFADQNDVEWGTPVLYMRVPDGRIFDVAATRDSAPAPPPPTPSPPPAPAAPAKPPQPAPAPAPAAVERLQEPDPAGPRFSPTEAVLAVVGVAMLWVGVFVPWDNHEGGRSWIDLKFPVPAHSGIVTALSPAAIAVGAAAGLLLAAFSLRRRELAAGLLIGFGVTAAVKYLGVFGQALAAPAAGEARRAVSILILAGVVVGAALLVWAGLRGARGAWRRPTAGSALAAALLVVAAIVIGIGTRVHFNGGGASKCCARSVLPDEGWLALDPVAGALAALALGFALFRGRSAVLAGAILAVGIEATALWVRYVGIPILEDDNVASVALGAVAGLLGSTLLLVVGLAQARRKADQRSTVSPGPPASG